MKKIFFTLICVFFGVSVWFANPSHDTYCSFKNQETIDANYRSSPFEPTYPGFWTDVFSVRKSGNMLYYIVNAMNLTSKEVEVKLYSWNCKKKQARLLYTFSSPDDKYQAYTLLSFDGRFAVYSDIGHWDDPSDTIGILDLQKNWKNKHVFLGFK